MSSYEGNNKTAETEEIEVLRKILEIEQKQPISYEEAFEVARLLVGFYDKLANNSLGIGQMAKNGEAG
jgi:hypothetical protein